MTEIPLYAADFSPGVTPYLVACAPGVLGFTTPLPDRTMTWLASDGSGRVAEPKKSSPTDRASFDIPRIDPIAPGWRLEMQAAPMALVLISRTARVVVELPRSLVADVLAIPHQRAPSVSFAREIDVLVIHGKHRAWWMPVARLLEMNGANHAVWRFHHVRPTGDRNARDEGIVLISAYGRTNIRVGDRAVMLGRTSLTKGERVWLIDRIADTNGILRYGAIERSDGERIELAAPRERDEEFATTIVQSSGTAERTAKPEVNIPANLQRAIDSMQREGLLGDMTPALYEKLARPEGWNPGATSISAFELLWSYYRDGDRAARDHALRDDGEGVSRQSVAQLAKLLGGEPLFTQKSFEPDVIRVRGRDGEDEIYIDAGLMDVVFYFNQELKARDDARRIFTVQSDDPRALYLALGKDVGERLARAGLPVSSDD